MFDTINFYLHDRNVDLSSLNQYIKNDVKRTINEVTGEWLFSQTEIGGFQFKFGMNWLSGNGSLPRLIYPDNTFIMSCEDVRRSLEMLSDELHFNMNIVNVTRIDVAATFSMKYPVEMYLDSLGELLNFARVLSVKGETSYYHQNNDKHVQKLTFYDKLKKNVVQPKGVKGENLLRYEREWWKQLPEQLNEIEVKGYTLYDERFYHKIAKLWADSYFAIAKRKVAAPDAIGMIKTPNDGFRYIVVKALQMLPIDFVPNQITDMQAHKAYSSPNSYSRLRRMFRDILNEDMMQETELTKELDEKIIEQIKKIEL